MHHFGVNNVPFRFCTLSTAPVTYFVLFSESELKECFYVKTAWIICWFRLFKYHVECFHCYFGV